MRKRAHADRRASVPAASGSKYEGQNLEFWTKGDEATVTWLDEDLKCQVKD